MVCQTALASVTAYSITSGSSLTAAPPSPTPGRKRATLVPRIAPRAALSLSLLQHFGQATPHHQRRRMAAPLIAASTLNDTSAGGNLTDVLSADEIGDDSVLIAVLGDLHLEPGQMPLFHEARDQILRVLDPYALAEKGDGSNGATDSPYDVSSTAWPNSVHTAADSIRIGGPGRQDRRLLVQLGDVGGYSCAPGSRECFKGAVRFLNSFHLPRMSVTGNHDLEGAEFESDEDNLEAWKHEFGHRSHHWVKDLGPAGVAIGLSTVRFRSSPASCHEIHVDDEQLEWFQERLKEHADRPVFVFSHAPPMGSGLTSLQTVHVRNRCAWLNHSSSNASLFLSLVRSHANIRLWFSGHFHLSHDYEGSISLLNNCLFVQTGVMGACNRDGRRHSRLLVASGQGYHLLTFDHTAGEARVDVAHRYADEARGMQPQRLWCSTLSNVTACPGGGPFAPAMPSDISARDASQFPPSALSPDGPSVTASGVTVERPLVGRGGYGMRSFSHVAGGVALGLAEGALNLEGARGGGGGGGEQGAPAVRWHTAGRTVLAEHANQLVEYDYDTHAPVGIVCDKVDGRVVRLVMEGGGRGDEGEEGGEEAESVVAVEFCPRGAFEAGEGGVERIERSPSGWFSQPYQVNKWRKRKLEEEARAAAEAAAAAASAASVATAASA